MKILDLHIDGFGKFHNRDISFSDGLNIVYGKNEAGKSTLHTFIRGMLFGIERQRGRASRNDTYTKYEPWTDSGTYEGRMRIESGGQIYRIERRFQKGSKSLSIINETLGKAEEPTPALWDKLRCGLSETAYTNTISIGQLKCATDQGMVGELRNYIANLNTSGSIALNITKASAYLRSQRREVESQMVPEAARTYASLLGEIRKMEQEIASPRYANQLAAFRSQKNQVKKQLEDRQKEKEALLEKAAKGRQILLNSQFTDPDSVTAYTENAKQLFADHQAAQEACAKKSRILLPFLFFLLAAVCLGGSGLCLAFPALTARYLSLPLPLPAMGGGLAGLALVFLAGAFFQLSKGRRFKKERGRTARLLSEIFSKHLGDSSISSEAMEALEAKMGEFLRLSRAVAQSEETLNRLTQDISGLQAREEGCSGQIEEQQRIQWELEQKLEHLDACKTKAESLKHVLAENERLQEELDAIDLAQDTMTTLSTSIRDSFGLYLNKTASDLISGITGGIYTSMSIDQNLDISMNTPTRLVPIEQVSSGAMDQIYLAVRLAAAKLVQSDPDTMPLIFDDSFVLYDDERLKTALKWLVKACDGQIIIFTCHKREAQLLTANQIPYHLITI